MSYTRAVSWQAVVAFGITVVAAVVAGFALTGAARWEVAAIMVVAGGISAFLLIRTSIAVRRSIDSVTQGAELIASGELAHRVFAPATDETRRLASAFNRMASVLQETVEGLSQERERLAALLETMGDGVLLIDRSGNIELINGAARRLVRMSSIGGRLRESDLLALAEESRNKGARSQDEIELLPGPRHVSAIATPLDRGHVLLTVHDLTLVRHVDVTRRQFVSNVSHELRNPLAAMGALVETLEGGAISDPHAAPDFVRRLRMEVTHMNALVADLLTLSRLESGHKDAEEDRADVERILHESREVQLKKRGEGAAEVIVQTPPALEAAISPLRLRQIVDNLVDNSLRFTARDGRITVRAREEDGMVLIQVVDTGKGIPPEHIPHIFERFYKADPSRHDPGTGLGLSIVKHIVETYRGSIEVQSEVGAGTTMSVRLPRAAYPNPNSVLAPR